jgi:hypothetical protein
MIEKIGEEGALTVVGSGGLIHHRPNQGEQDFRVDG